MIQNFNNKEDLIEFLNIFTYSLNSTHNPNSIFNIFCHHINDSKVNKNNLDTVIDDIFDNGLKCRYSSILRTATYIGNTSSSLGEKIYNYGYVTTDFKNRNIIVLALPKSIKKNSGELVDFCTPEGNQFNWKQRAYCIYDHIKNPYKLDPFFTLCSVKIDEHNNQFSVKVNPNHFGIVSNKTKLKYLKSIRDAIDAYENPFYHNIAQNF